MKYNKNKKKKLQQGGTIPRKNIIEQLLGIRPSTTVPLNNQEFGYSYKRPVGNSIYSEIVKNIPYGNGELVSQRKISNPGTTKADTVYTMPSGQRVTDAVDLNRYKNKFGQLDSLTEKKEDGGKVDPKAVMAEARRLQALEKQENIARSSAAAVANSGIPSYQRQTASIEAPKQQVNLNTPANTNLNFKGKRYSTALASDKPATKTAPAQAFVDNISPMFRAPQESTARPNVVPQIAPQREEVVATAITPTKSVKQPATTKPILGDVWNWLTAKKVYENAASSPNAAPSKYNPGNYTTGKRYASVGGFNVRFQQGGKVETNDQIYVDFAVRYLKSKGVSEEDMVDESGSLREAYIEEVSDVIQQVDTPEFWQAYKEDPDAAINSYVQSISAEPEDIEMAKKGAKLKQLKNKKMRKCKCGCNLTLKKETGGTIVEVCACGCKNK